MTMPARRPATYDDIVALPEHGGDDTVIAEPFEAAAVDLKRIWGR